MFLLFKNVLLSALFQAPHCTKKTFAAFFSAQRYNFFSDKQN